jgi:hypothetical protein
MKRFVCTVTVVLFTSIATFPQNQTPTSMLNALYFVDSFQGSDCGAKINSALSLLGANPGNLYMTPRCGSITSPVVLGNNQHLAIAPGSYYLSATITVGMQSSIECPPTADTSGGGLGSCLFTESPGANLPSMFALTGTNAALVNVTLNGNYSVNQSAGPNVIVTGIRCRLDHVNTELARSYGVSIGDGRLNVAAGTKISHLMAISNQSDGVHCSVTSDVYLGEESEIENNLGNGIKLVNCGAFRTSGGVDVSGNMLDGISISGSSTAVVSAFNSVITNVVLSQNGENDIEIQGWDEAHATYASLGNIVSNNLFQGSTKHGSDRYDAIHIQDSGYNAINGNIVQDPYGPSFEFRAGIDLISVNGELADTVTGNNVIVIKTPLTWVTTTVVCANALNNVASICK